MRAQFSPQETVPVPQRPIHIAENFARRSITPERLVKVGGVDIYHVIQPPSEFSDALTQHMLCVLFHTNWGNFRQINRFAGKQYDGSPSPLSFLLLPALTPAFFAWNETDESIIFTIEPRILERVAMENDCLNPSQVELKPIIYDRDLKLEFFAKSFYEEVTQNTVGTKLYTESLANLFFIHLLRNYCTFTAKLRQYKDGLSPRKLQQAINYIQDNLAEDISLEAIAKELNMSRYHFSRLFSQSMGTAPYQYAIQQRVEKAKQLLKQKDLSMVEIALECGFSSQSAFSRTFSKCVGTTPRKYRQQL